MTTRRADFLAGTALGTAFVLAALAIAVAPHASLAAILTGETCLLVSVAATLIFIVRPLGASAEPEGSARPDCPPAVRPPLRSGKAG